jgi:hypothetical protein
LKPLRHLIEKKSKIVLTFNPQGYKVKNMKLIDGKLTFDVVTCWDCKGTREVKRYRLCSRYGKPTRGYKCECGAKNRHSHQAVGSYMTACTTCEGKGTRTENRFDTLPSEIFHALPIALVDKNYRQNFSDSYLGIGLVGGSTDYGAMAHILKTQGENAVFAKVREDYDNHSSGRQACGFMHGDKFCKALAVRVGETGYSVKPLFA